MRPVSELVGIEVAETGKSKAYCEDLKHLTDKLILGKKLKWQKPVIGKL
ncbi:hypothetical protein [Vibrio cyclitrophicus]|nr:hypothetical protein [Vibrio cyclitrophicus]ERM57974.1 hypothetical protein M565_ctg5P0945 [Vibrio cyclitrophicus FF75]